MATANSGDMCLDSLWKMKCVELRNILRTNKGNTSGNKSILVARCHALINPCMANEVTDQLSKHGASGEKAIRDNPLSSLKLDQTITYNDLTLTAKGRQWCNDLRLFPETNFHQLITYFVERTRKYGDREMKGFVYKKMRAYQFFEEGHISEYEIAKGFNLTWVKAKVIASMRNLKYKVISVFNSEGDVLHAACECPAGLGIGGAGKCNHIGGLLFAVSDFQEKGLRSQPQKISCTSKLNGWIVPRNLKVPPQPINDLKLKKIKLGKTRKLTKSVNRYDPRAPHDRVLDSHAVQELHQSLKDCLPNSAFFLYHENLDADEEQIVDFYDELTGQDVSFNVSVEADFMYEQHETPSVESVSVPLIEHNQNIPDSVPVDDAFIENYVNISVEKENLSDQQILEIEKQTTDQSENILWQKLHKHKITASNFGKVCKCQKNPDGVISYLLYSYSRSSMKSLHYGKLHECDAIKAYISAKEKIGKPVKVKKAGLLLSRERPSYGVSLDGRVEDLNSPENDKYGGLECKCPISKCGLTPKEACQDKNFYLKCENGEIHLKSGHDYYVQVQGQMFISGLKWVDFVVWFGNEVDVFIERIHFDEDKWYNYYLPALNLFHK